MTILGIDEVGRGAWAGPLVVGAVVLGEPIDGLADSKLLTKKRREELAEVVRASGASIGLGWVSAQELDTVGLSEALKLATRRAVEQVKAPYHEIIIDGTVNFLADTVKGRYVTTLKKADQLIAAVSAASIVAKVARDEYMTALEAKYPDHGFANHVGYGTAAHRLALAKLGPCPEHRQSFKPICLLPARFCPPSQPFSPPISSAPLEEIAGKADCPESLLTSRQIGDKAETKVAEFLKRQGYKVLARNWRTKACEIDIVAEKNQTLYFVEVKYRKDSKRGGGLAAVTPKKLKQMEFAAQVFAAAHGLSAVDKRLAVADVTDKNHEIKNFLILS